MLSKHSNGNDTGKISHRQTNDQLNASLVPTGHRTCPRSRLPRCQPVMTRLTQPEDRRPKYVA